MLTLKRRLFTSFPCEKSLLFTLRYCWFVSLPKTDQHKKPSDNKQRKSSELNLIKNTKTVHVFHRESTHEYATPKAFLTHRLLHSITHWNADCLTTAKWPQRCEKVTWSWLIQQFRWSWSLFTKATDYRLTCHHWVPFSASDSPRWFSEKQISVLEVLRMFMHEQGKTETLVPNS